MSRQHLEACFAVAQRFAEALDREDYAAAGDCLDPHCRYRIDEDLHEGPEAILASYRASGDWAKTQLDGVRYESALCLEGERVVVSFLDHLEHAGRRFTHTCEQVLEFGDDGRIVAIEHRHLSGEREALDRFFEATGLRRRGIEDQSGQ